MSPGAKLENFNIINRSEIFGREKIAHTIIQRERVVLSDKATILVTILKPEPDAQIELEIFPPFLEKHIALGNRNIIDQSKTQAEWSAEVGVKPEKYLTENTESIAFCPTNAGWQRGAIWIKDGRPLFIPNDQNTLNADLTLFGKTETGWNTRKTHIMNGKLIPNDEAIKEMSLGFSLPLLIEDGEVLPLQSYLRDPRILADLRNLFDFSQGTPLPDAFWLTLRKLLPDSLSSAQRLLNDQVVVYRAPNAVSESEIAAFKDILVHHHLEKVFSIDTKYDYPRLVINQSLPLGRIPCFGIGYDKDHQLVVIAVDGRQALSPGVMITELGPLMQKYGIVTGGLGSAGGDVAIVSNQGRIINSIPATRPVPSVITIK